MNEANLKKARQTAIIIVTSLTLMLIAFVYAFVQQRISNDNKVRAVDFEKRAQQTELECLELRKKYDAQLDQLSNELERSNEMLQKLNAKSK